MFGIPFGIPSHASFQLIFIFHTKHNCCMTRDCIVPAPWFRTPFLLAAPSCHDLERHSTCTFSAPDAGKYGIF